MRAAGLSMVGIAGTNTRQIIDNATQAASRVGVAGNLGKVHHQAVTLLAPEESEGQNNLGDRTQIHGWKKGVFFADYTYLVSPYARMSDGSLDPLGMHWRDGRADVFARGKRSLPLLLDSTGFRRVLTGTAPKWADAFARYPQAIDLIDPDGYAAWDNPLDKGESLRYLELLRSIYPGDPRLWPIYSIRWSWDDRPPYRLHDLPRWASTRLLDLVPRTPTHARQFPSDLEEQARVAVLNAVIVARDPVFQEMVDRHGQVMIAGMVKGPCHRFVRHLFVKALYALIPAHYWLLGQASSYVTNGLAYTGLIDHISMDGSWWVQDALCHKVAYVHDGLINVADLGGPGRESFFTTRERMAALLRSLLSMYAHLIEWPSAPALPIDFRDLEQLVTLRGSYQHAQMELEIGPGDWGLGVGEVQAHRSGV